HGPVDEEDRDERLKGGAARLALLRDLRECERPDNEDPAQEDERVRESPVRGAKGVREAEKEVRKHDEECDDDPPYRALRQVAGMVRDQAQQLEEAERAERE